MKSAIFENAAELEEAVGDAENPGGLWTSGESVVNEFYSGNTSVLNRLGPAMTSSITIDELTAEPIFENNLIQNVKVKAGELTQELVVDKWTGSLYALVTLGDVTELYYISDWRISVKPFNTTNEEGEVVMEYNLAVYDELKDGEWVADDTTNEEVMKAGFVHYAKDNENFKGAFND